MRTLALTLLLAFALAAEAAADGLPIGGPEIGHLGLEVAGDGTRVVALAAGGETTLARLRGDGGGIERWARIDGRYTIPAVALDGSPGGLTSDGRTMVLIRPRPGFPQKETRLAVISTRSLRLERRIDLRGDFSFDALSPDGRRLYLVEYTSPRDPTRYLVRAYDLRRGRLLPEPIVDPEESPDEMRGFALTRATSPDSRWAYTLYDGNGEHPFVHALDTVDAKAVCIDLDALQGRAYEQLSLMRLRPAAGGRTLEVLDGGEPLLRIDTRSFEVARAAAPPAARPAGAAHDNPGSPAWRAAGIAALTLALALAVSAAACLRSRRSPRR